MRFFSTDVNHSRVHEFSRQGRWDGDIFGNFALVVNEKVFNLWHRISAIAVLLVSAVTYLLTLEPTASFWDCSEYVVSSYKLEVGHPPGNPV